MARDFLGIGRVQCTTAAQKVSEVNWFIELQIRELQVSHAVCKGTIMKIEDRIPRRTQESPEALFARCNM